MICISARRSIERFAQNQHNSVGEHVGEREKFMKIARFLAATALGSLVAVAPAYAQDAQDEDTYEDNVIIVTASKRESTLQETPISVSVTTGETLENAQIRDVLDLQTVTPLIACQPAPDLFGIDFHHSWLRQRRQQFRHRAIGWRVY